MLVPICISLKEISYQIRSHCQMAIFTFDKWKYQTPCGVSTLIRFWGGGDFCPIFKENFIFIWLIFQLIVLSHTETDFGFTFKGLEHASCHEDRVNLGLDSRYISSAALSNWAKNDTSSCLGPLCSWSMIHLDHCCYDATKMARGPGLFYTLHWTLPQKTSPNQNQAVVVAANAQSTYKV